MTTGVEDEELDDQPTPRRFSWTLAGGAVLDCLAEVFDAIGGLFGVWAEMTASHVSVDWQRQDMAREVLRDIERLPGQPASFER